MNLRLMTLICVSIAVAGCEPRSAIHDAVSSGDVEKVRLLLAHDPKLVNLESGDEIPVTPLCIAAEAGDENMVKLLLEAGARIEAEAFGATVLSSAAARGRLEVVKLLVAKGAIVNTHDDPPLIEAARNGYKDVVDFLLASGANVNVMWVVGRGNTNERIVNTPLKAAAEGGHWEIMQLLLDRGANVNAQGTNDFTALHMAVLGHFRKEEHRHGVELLLERGASVNAKGYKGMAALHLAAEGMPLYDPDRKVSYFESVGTDVVESLIAGGADVNAPDDDGRTPLHYAVANRHDEIVKVLVEHGAR